jgi:hypothetical protein
MDKELDKMVEVATEEAFLEQQEKYIYEEELANAEDECCTECTGRSTYYLRKGI